MTYTSYYSGATVEVQTFGDAVASGLMTVIDECDGWQLVRLNLDDYPLVAKRDFRGRFWYPHERPWREEDMPQTLEEAQDVDWDTEEQLRYQLLAESGYWD